MSFTVTVRVAPWTELDNWQKNADSDEPAFQRYGWGMSAKVQGYDGINYYTSSDFWLQYDKIKDKLSPDQISHCDRIYQDFFPDDDEQWFPTTFIRHISGGMDQLSYASPKTIRIFHESFQAIDFDNLLAIYKENLGEETADSQKTVFTQWKDLCSYCVENDLGWEIHVG